MRESKKGKKQRFSLIVNELKALYPVAKCSLEYEGEPWKLLVMGRLSAQCTDARVNIICRVLFEKYKTPEELAHGDIVDIENIIHSCGLYKTKADSIKRSCLMLVEDYYGVLPDNMEELLKFPGVGRKIANLLLGDIFHKNAIVADTHCIRISGRLGAYSTKIKNPLITERTMSQLIEEKEQSDFCHRIVLFGREYCTARSPKCNICPMRAKDLCFYQGK